ncbi:MAG: calcineurin-like phosphoesterase C-terminal domain-containing protein [Paludibacteraceae bacterium]
MKKKYTVLFLLFISFISLYAQTSVVRGKITCDNKPLYGVAVTDGENFSSTNKQGCYELNVGKNNAFIYYTLPSGYKSPVKNGVPYFFEKNVFQNKNQNINFEVIKEKKSQEKYTLMVMADPQVAEESEFKLLNAVLQDMKKLITDKSTIQPIYAIACGDIVFDKLNFFDNYKKLISQLGIPFYQSIGNHDMDYNNRSNELSTASYGNAFGPSHYSFNIGKIHYIILDDVFYYGFTYRYLGYIDEKQLSWLEKDLQFVPKGSTVIVTLHIPTIYNETEKADYTTTISNSVMNNKALYKIFDSYNLHIFAGHSHKQWNTQVNNNIIEHVHAAACGAWWQGDICTDGTPKGYTVYEIDGSNIAWYYKSVGFNKAEQFKLYSIGTDSENNEFFIANVYNYDDKWKVQWTENDTIVGEMQRYWGKDPLAEKTYLPDKNKKYSWLNVSETQHLFKAKPKNPQSKIKVIVTDRFGNEYEKILK